VWVQHQGDGTDIFAQGGGFRLCVFDTDDPRGERLLLPAESNYYKPLITPEGTQVVFSNVKTRTVYVVNWDGTGLREVTSGVAAAVWRDPQAGHQWVYVQVGPETGVAAKKNPIWRVRLDDPQIGELVWDKTPVNPDGFQISADGRRVCSLFPWPHFAVAVLPNEALQELGKGCCAALAPDGPDVAFHLLGDHRTLMMYALDTRREWKVSISGAPGVNGYESYHPKFANRGRYLVMCGPFIGQGGCTAEIYLGRFTPDWTAVEKWVRVTTNEKGDFWPDVWIDPASAPPTAPPGGPPALPGGPLALPVAPTPTGTTPGAPAGGPGPVLAPAAARGSKPAPTIRLNLGGTPVTVSPAE
jgi:hypothetical protein